MSFVKQIAGGLGGKVAGAALTFACSVLLARILGAEGYGAYSIAVAVATIALVPAQLGLPSLVVRETASFLAEGSWRRVNSLWRWAHRTALITASAVTILALLAIYQSQGPYRVLLGIAAFTIVPTTLNSLRAAMLRGAGHVAVGVMPEYIIKPLALMAIVAICFLMGAQSAELAVGASVAASMVTYFIGRQILKLKTPAAAWSAQPPIGHAVRKDWLGAAVWLSVLASSQVISQQIDVVLVAALLDPVAVGVFKVAVSAAALIVFALNAVNLVTAPYFSRLLAQNKMADLQKLVTRTSRLTLLFALPLCALFAIGGDRIVGFFYGSEFVPAANCIRILCVGQLINASFGAVSGLMTMARQQRTVIAAFAVALAINVAVSLILVPIYGIEGAAIGSSFSLAIWNVALAVICRRRVGIWTFAFSRRRPA